MLHFPQPQFPPSKFHLVIKMTFLVETLPQYEEYLCRYDNSTTTVWKYTCVDMVN